MRLTGADVSALASAGGDGGSVQVIGAGALHASFCWFHANTAYFGGSIYGSDGASITLISTNITNMNIMKARSQTVSDNFSDIKQHFEDKEATLLQALFFRRPHYAEVHKRASADKPLASPSLVRQLSQRADAARDT